MERSRREQIIQDQIAERAKYAASVVAAIGNVVKDAFVSTVSEARTIGDKAVVFGALAGAGSFFLPWFTFLGVASTSGLRAAIDVSWVWWLHPLSMIACFLMFSFNKESDARKRILAARWYIMIGTLWFGPGVAAVCDAFSGTVGFGGYIATGSAASILLGGILQVSERLQDLVPVA